MRFKNIKKKAKKAKSPSNSRTISESFNSLLPKLNNITLLKIYRRSLKVFIAFIFMLTVLVVGLDLNENLKTKQSINLEREKLTKELIFWKDFINEYQDYRDAYFQAAILEYKLGDTSNAKIYLEKGLSLDPNSEDGRKIEMLLNK